MQYIILIANQIYFKRLILMKNRTTGFDSKKSIFSAFFFNLYRINRESIRNFILHTVNRLEGGEFYSLTLRAIFNHYHMVNIGLYSHGGCFKVRAFDKHTTVGRYCSIAYGTKGFNRNHPISHKSTHAFFFNTRLGFCNTDNNHYNPLTIGHDVWIGANAMILPRVSNIGTGAIIAAGAIVNKDVPPYSIIAGNPGKIVKFRFSNNIIENLLNSKWWENSIVNLKNELSEFQFPLE